MAALNKLSLPSPAKINHFLHIISRREDGYHNLETLFQFLDMSDTLHFALRDDSQIVILPEHFLGIPLEKNLIYKAAKALQEKANLNQGITITIEKRLPIGGGLGGGSSNAATTLVALNTLWQINYSIEQLISIGAKIGADVPIFIFGQSAYAEGIGEKLTPTLLPELWVLAVIPPCEVSTPKMFAERDLTRNTPSLKIAALAQGEVALDLDALANNFEPIVRKCYPEVEEAFQWLSNFGKPRLSGSGACVFASFDSEREAKTTLSCLPKYFKGFVAKGINHSPLQLAVKKSKIQSTLVLD